jgi:polysaccharide pyruvyl transferase WcaK-like protein
LDFNSYLHLVFCILYLATMNCLLIGNYGVANLGDEALREYFIKTFPDVTWTVLSADPKEGEVPRLPLGIRSFFRFNWIKTLKAYRQADAVVFGGGSLWTDVESVYACYLWSLHVLAARIFHKPVLLAFQGIGPFKTAVGEKLARWAVRHATFVSVRDEQSMRRVMSWSLNIKIIQTFDPVFSLMHKQKMNRSVKNVYTIIPRANSSETLMQTALSALRIHPYMHHVQILLMQPDDPAEQAFAVRLERELGSPATTVPVLDDLLKGVAGSAMVLSERFHGALAALACGIELDIVAQGKGDKLAALRDKIAAGFDADAAQELIMQGERELRSALTA